MHRLPANAGRRNARCEHCDAPLVTSREKKEGFCHRLKCRGPSLRRQGERARAARRRERMNRTNFRGDVRSFLHKRFQNELPQADTLPLLIVPSNDRALEPVSDTRRAAFRSYLQAAMTEAIGLAAQDLPEPVEPPQEEAASLAIINACIVCRGWCCRHGEDHAFLRPSWLARRLRREPETSPEQMIEDYLSLVPDEAYSRSCIYHTSQGCAQKRETRSTICNEFLCQQIQKAPADAWPDAKSPDTPVVAVASNGDLCLRVGVMTPNGTRQEFAVEQLVPRQAPDEAP